MALIGLNSTAWYTSLQSKKHLVGGVHSIKLWEQVYTPTAVSATNSLELGTAIDSTHDIVLVAGNYPTGVVTYRFAPEQSTFTVSTSQENGLALHTCSIEGFIPEINATTLGGLQALVGKGLMGTVKLQSGKTNTGGGSLTEVLVGWDNVLGDKTAVSGTDHLTSQFALFLESVEMSSGSTMTDDVGATVKLTAVQGEIPRQISAS
tara:strand:+ start:2635 stop:3252 length:618 start_codon:yes stop_codon:yes gene_type:complete